MDFSFKIHYRFVSTSFDEKQVSAFGWDTGPLGGQSSELQRIDFNQVLNQASCKKAYPNGTSRQFCTNSARGENTCKLGSSAEILYTDKTNTIFIIGVLNRGGCTGPILNTKVTELLDWIQSTTPDAIYCLK